jgi:hypothetical protein
MATKMQNKGGHPAYTTEFIRADSDQVRFFDDPMTDNIVTALVALSMETWSIRRRSLVLERLLEEKGVSQEMIEGYLPSDVEAAAWEKERDRFVGQVMGPLMREGNLSPSAKRKDNP